MMPRPLRMRHCLHPERIFRLAGWVLVAIVIVASLVPGQDRPRSGAPGGLEHILAYMVTSTILALGYRDAQVRMILAAFLILLSAMLEALQLVIPARTSELAGFLASASGTIMGFLLVIILAHRIRVRER